MKNTKRKHSAEFKARVALAAIREDKTVAEIAQEYQIHPTLINDWKKLLLSQSNQIFENPKSKNKEADISQAQLNKLYCKIGQLEVERDFLASRPGLLDLIKGKI